MDKKLTGIVAYLTVIGWLIAFFAGDREGAKFHLNQALILVLASACVAILTNLNGFLAVIGGILGLLVAVLWVISFVHALCGEEKGASIIGDIHILK